MSADFLANHFLLIGLVGLQVLLGLTDTLLHHEFSERLAWRVSAKKELKLHALRNFIYMILFLAFAWGQPKGAIAWFALVLIVLEVLITLWDFVEEDLSRKLPTTERVLHTLLTLNYGAILSLLLPLLWQQTKQPTGYTPAYAGFGSIALSIAAFGVLLFAVRDFYAAKRLNHLGRGDVAPMTIGGQGKKHILITGATGFIGTRLAKTLLAHGHALTVLARDPQKAAKLGAPLQIVTDLDQIPDDAPIDAVINLAGESVANGLWTKRKKEKIIQSRSDLLEKIYTLSDRLYVRPKLVLTASAVGWYGLRGDEKLDETSAPQDCFSHLSCAAVETKLEAFKQLNSTHSNIRLVALRIGLVLDPSGGLLAKLLTPFDLGLGGRVGSGKQWMSWIDLDDIVRLILFTLANDKVEGPLNATAPNPVRNSAFAKTLARALGRPCLFPLPAKVLSFVGGDMARELLLSGQYVAPKKALDLGFTFEKETLEDCLLSCVGYGEQAQSKKAPHA